MLTLLLGCWVYKKAPDAQIAEGGQDLKTVEGVVGLAPTAFLSDLNGVDDDFRDGSYVGNVVMSGGYVLENNGDAGIQTVSKNYELNSIETYRETVADWVDVTFAKTLDTRKTIWRRVDARPETPIRRPVRGSHPLDGTDNINIPRFTLEPSAIAPMDDVDVVIVPLVVHYYTHNGGWFIGQEKGCGAGARFRLLWTVYDAASGAPLAWRDVDQRSVEEYLFQANSAQLEDLLIEVEDGVRKDLHRQLLR